MGFSRVIPYPHCCSSSASYLSPWDADTAPFFKDQNRTKLNHLWYMDDIKLYSKNEKVLRSLVHTVPGCSQDIGMQCCVAKCATVVLKAGKHAASSEIILPDRSIRSLRPEETHKYLGFLEAGGKDHSSMRTKILQECKCCVRRVFRSALNGHNIITAINTWL